MSSQTEKFRQYYLNQTVDMPSLAIIRDHRCLDFVDEIAIRVDGCIVWRGSVTEWTAAVVNPLTQVPDPDPDLGDWDA